MSDIRVEDFYDHTVTKLDPEHVRLVRRALKKRRLLTTNLPEMLGLTVEEAEEDATPAPEALAPRTLTAQERRGARLPAWRAKPLVENMQKAGKGVAEIAKVAGCSRGTIYRILNDQQSVPSVVVERLEAAA